MKSNERDRYMEGLASEEVLDYIWSECKGAESFIKGSVIEMGFTKAAQLAGWSASKVNDQDRSQRYDFNVGMGDNNLRFEVKTLCSNGSVHIGYKDYREIILPSGMVWKTKARCISEDFDYFAVSLINFGYKNTEFACVAFDRLPRLTVKNSKKKHYEDIDRAWIKENYIALTVKPESLSPLDKDFVYLRDLLTDY
jgi:hypothetical protein